MILADKIIMLRKKKGWSQEELAEQLDVSRQSVSKWEGNLSNPDLDKIIAMSELFGVSTDYLLKDEFGDEQDEGFTETDAEGPETEHIRFDPVRTVAREEAERYLGEVEKMSWWIATGVLLCILSPATLILLCGFAAIGWMDSNLAVGLGLLALFVLVAIAIMLFIPSGIRLSKFEYLKTEAFTLDRSTQQSVRESKSQYEKTYILLLTAGVILCVLGAAQLVVLASLLQSELYTVASVSLLLVFVSVGVFLMVRSGNIYEAYQKLLQEGEYERRENAKKSDFFSTIYWCAALAIYLGTSFLTDAWHLTWIIWPVVAVLSPIIDMLDRKFVRK
ncbi:MAG: helix-turn-helix transcriptional regulator [Clostridia bacterium]|nr:helix-turn-helix transcriptional regulator [Clostridia bacterium]